MTAALEGREWSAARPGRRSFKVVVKIYVPKWIFPSENFRKYLFI